MALKGHVSIELTDVNTKEVQKIEGDNMLTNAISKYCTMLSAKVLKSGLSASSANFPYLTPYPIAKQLLGGLLVFSDNLTENANNISLPPTDNEVLAMCDNTLSNEDKRGSYNTSESQEQTNGFKHVWDFSTNQCNGEINALALTNLSGGVTHFYYDGYINLSNNRIFPALYQLAQASSPQPFGMGGGTYKPVYYDLDTQELFFVGFTTTSPRKFIIYKTRFLLNSFKLNDDLYSDINTNYYDFELVSEHEIVYSYASSFGNIHNDTTYYDKSNATITIPIYLRSSSSELFYIIISTLDWSISEQTITLPTAQVGGMTAFGFNDGCLYYVKTFTAGTPVSTTIIKAPISDPSDYVEISATFDTAFSGSTSSICVNPVVGMGVSIFYGGGTSKYGYVFVDKDTNVADAKVFTEGGARECLISDLLFVRDAQMTLHLNPCYLGTIYNLISPITKTANQTMKIIYTLTDATE